MLIRCGYRVASSGDLGQIQMKALPARQPAPLNTEIYTWTFPGSPIRIELGLDVVARLQKSISSAQTNGEAGEVGGVLLGNFRSPSTVEVMDYLLIEADPDCKRSYIADELELQRLCSGHGPKPAGKVVGYFRTQGEPALRLRDEEFETLQRHFNDVRQVVLLISTGSEQCMGGFLFWDSGRLNPFSFLEFPFSAEMLSYEANPQEDAYAVPKPEIVPPSKPASAAPKGRLTRIMLAAGLIVLVALGAVFAYERRPKTVVTRPSQPVVEQPATQIVFSAAPLQLQVEAQGDGLNVHWDPESKTIAKAREGRLTIVENGNTRVIPLNAQQLIRGHVYYQPSADQVEFTLEVVDDSGASTEEFVLALSSKTNKSVQSIPLARPTADLTAAKKKPEDDVARSIPKTFKLPPAKQNAVPAAPTVIQDAPPVVKLDGTPPNNLPVGRISAPQVTAVAPAPAQVLKTPAVNPSAAPEIKAPVRVAPTYQTAVAKKKTSPVLPASIAAKFPPGGRVEVTLDVHIDETGRVTRAEAEPRAQKTPVDSELDKMAIDAMLRWRFDPARTGDKPVASDQGVTFVFERAPGQ